MKLTVRMSDIAIPEPAVLLNGDDCLELGVSHMDRVRIMAASSVIASLSVSNVEVPKGVVGMPAIVMERCGAEDGGMVEVTFAPMPESARSIRKKINGEKLTREEIDAIVEDIMDEDDMQDIYDYFMEESETDDIDEALDALGEDYTETEIRLVRIKFLSEMAN